MDQNLADATLHQQQVNIAIVGGGICGLATALALHRYIIV